MNPTSESPTNVETRFYLGYNFSSAIAGDFVPQRVQNLCIREYARTHGLPLSFNISEYADAARALMLFNQFDHAHAFAGFIFYSLLQLPEDRARRREFFARVTQLAKPVYFALEDLRLAAVSDLETVERVFRISRDPRLDQIRETLTAMHR